MGWQLETADESPTAREILRQILFAGIGQDGQENLLGSSAALVGCGALGTVVANLLVRGGLGRLRIIDRDFVEPSNLQRQMLFDESDAREALPKAVAAQRHLRAINSDAEVEGVVADLTPANASELLGGVQIVLDGRTTSRRGCSSTTRQSRSACRGYTLRLLEVMAYDDDSPGRNGMPRLPSGK